MAIAGARIAVVGLLLGIAALGMSARRSPPTPGSLFLAPQVGVISSSLTRTPPGPASVNGGGVVLRDETMKMSGLTVGWTVSTPGSWGRSRD